jgi:hypothetical protein
MVQQPLPAAAVCRPDMSLAALAACDVQAVLTALRRDGKTRCDQFDAYPAL